MPSSSSRDRNVEDTYEAQNDQRLDDLHSKIRTLRGVRLNHLRSSVWLLTSGQVTTDIHRDVESQNLLLDESVRLPPSASSSDQTLIHFRRPGQCVLFVHNLPLGFRPTGESNVRLRYPPPFSVPPVVLTVSTGSGTPKQYRILVYSVGSVLSLWLLWKILSWLFSGGSPEPIPTGESYGI